MKVLIVPPVLALLPQYASIEDPIPELRGAVEQAVTWLGSARVLAAGPQGARVGAALLSDAADVADLQADNLLVLANGSAKRTDKAPGHFDSRAEAFDEQILYALGTGDLAALAGIDRFLAQELWAEIRPLTRVVDELGEQVVVDIDIDYQACPMGVAWWVVRWQCE